MRLVANFSLLSILVVCNSVGSVYANEFTDSVGAERGIVAIIGKPETDSNELSCLEENELTFFLHVETAAEANALQQSASEKAVLGTRVFISHGKLDEIPLGDNVADGVLVSPSAYRLRTV